jgi:exonuclease SbcC
MRIRSLRFRGVGPYRDEQFIDFDQLGSSGLYLINGPTGSGKSTIIDCITFALYGKLAADEADISRMRSDFARPNEPTEVDLVFETAAGTYRVIRTPEYMRAKQRGTGETKAHATCHVFRVGPDGDETQIADNVGSAATEVTRVVGLSRAQFVQTVVLPQGQFAKFLYSGTSDRAAILKQIFNTRVYERVAEILKEDAKAAADAASQATEAITAQIRQLAALTGLADDLRDVLVSHAAQRLDPQLRAALEGLEPGFASALADADRVLAEARALAEAADTTRAQAKAEADAVADVEQAATARDDASEAVVTARIPVDAAAAVAAEVGIDIDDSTEVEAWRSRASRADTLVGTLSGLVAAEDAVLAWPQEEQRTRAEIAEHRAREAADRDRLGALPDLLDAQQAIVDARPTLAEGTAVKEREATLGEVTRQFTALDAEVAGLPTLESRVDTLLAQSTLADQALAQAGRAYREGIAAELAQQLQDGTPCPVCGATEHPVPATHHAEPVTFERVEELRIEASDAHGLLEAARSTLLQARQRSDDLRAALTMSRETLDAQLERVGADAAGLADRAQAADAADAALRDLRTEQQEISERVAGYGATIAALESALDERTTAIASRAEDVAQARGSAPSVRDRLAAVQQLGSAVGTLADRLAELATAADAHERATAALASLPQHEGFADVTAAADIWAAADEQRQQAVQARTDAHTRHQRLRSGTAEILRLCEARAQQVEEGQDLVDLARLFAAGTGRDIGLHVYVLQSLFETVMDAANRRFESLLNGRYLLVPDPEADGDGRTHQGLGVLVEDRLTGRTRSARSLSGGETFCASLALALGLSDVVRTNAGGIEIDSLFIDEGFGSLDNDQLDEVMVMLGHLSSGGRRVGVISHVDSMKASITERIDVTPVGENRPTSLTVSWMS